MFQPDEATTQLLKNNEPQPIPIQNLRVRTWFLENIKGEIVAAGEGDAWRMIQPNQHIGTHSPIYRIIGVSMANIYAKCVEGLMIDKTSTPEEKKALLRQAFADEVVEARKHIIRPRNPNIMDISGQPADPAILNQLR